MDDFIYNNLLLQKYQSSMSTRNAWLPQEDKILLMLYQQRNIRKWSKISKIMANQFKIQNKTGKKCRQRYHNHLNPELNRGEWSPAQEDKLIALQRDLGNKWALISKELPGRTDNAVKNKFYSKVRKALRRINQIKKYIVERKFKELKICFIYKLNQIIDAHQKLQGKIKEGIAALAQELIQKILRFEDQPYLNHLNQFEKHQIRQNQIRLVSNIFEGVTIINKNYFKKKGRQRSKYELQDSNSEQFDQMSHSARRLQQIVPQEVPERNKEVEKIKMEEPQPYEAKFCYQIKPQTKSQQNKENMNHKNIVIIDPSIEMSHFIKEQIRSEEKEYPFHFFEEASQSRDLPSEFCTGKEYERNFFEF